MSRQLLVGFALCIFGPLLLGFGQFQIGVLDREWMVPTFTVIGHVLTVTGGVLLAIVKVVRINPKNDRIDARDDKALFVRDKRPWYLTGGEYIALDGDKLQRVIDEKVP